MFNYYQSHIKLVLILVIMFLISCTEISNPTLPEGEGRVKGYVHGVITDAHDSAPLSGVKVTYLTKDSTKSVLSNSSGFYSISRLEEGEYELIYELTDYAIRLSPVDVSDPGGNFDELDEVDFIVSISKSLVMYKKNATITGSVFAFQDEENTLPAEGAIVNLDVDVSGFRDILNRKMTTTVDNTGSFRFDNVPSVSTASWTVLPYTNSEITYGVSTGELGIINGSETSAGNIILFIAGAVPLVIANNFDLNEFPVGDDLTLLFSKAIDPSSVDVVFSGPFGLVNTESSFDANNLLLTVNPSVTLVFELTYNLSVSGRSVDGNSFFYFFSFGTELGISVTSLNIQRLDGQARNDFGIDGNIVVTFTREANRSFSIVRLYAVATGLEVPSTVTWTDGGTKATLNPTNSLNSGSSYSFRLEPVLSSLENDQLFQTFTFTTQ